MVVERQNGGGADKPKVDGDPVLARVETFRHPFDRHCPHGPWCGTPADAS
jgi:hypothetical protein